MDKFQSADIDWPFPDEYFKSIGLTVSRFQFLQPNLPILLKSFFLPSANLINTEPVTEEVITVQTQYSFYPEQESIEEIIKKYKDVPTFYFINESYFLYNKSDLIKETFITALQKKKKIYGSISYFNKKTKDEIFKTLSTEKLLKVFVNKDAKQNSLSFQLTNISGEIPKLKDNRVYNFFLTKIGRKRKIQMPKPIEIIIIRAQQSFEIAGGLNSFQTEIEDDRVLNMLKKYKNVTYRLTPLGMLFLASTKNNTEQIFITCREN